MSNVYEALVAHMKSTYNSTVSIDTCKKAVMCYGYGMTSPKLHDAHVMCHMRLMTSSYGAKVNPNLVHVIDADVVNSIIDELDLRSKYIFN